jgi:acyl-CoA synthetase (NDP forming)
LLGVLPTPAPARPLEQVRRLIEPRSIAVLGVSSKRENFGRIIVRNICQRGFPPDRLRIVKQGDLEIDGIRCVSDIDQLPGETDLLVACAAAEQAPQLIGQLVGPAAGRIRSAIVISGGVGEKEGTEQAMSDLRERIAQARREGRSPPVFLGANCMGVRSAPGRYDTFFIPPQKLPPPATARPLALVSQSGAFIITRSSSLAEMAPAISVSLGNQMDVTAADVTQVIAAREDIHCIGVYVEGFADLDGLAFASAVADARRSGKSVVFYKAGRTAAGRTAAQGHTASLAGDWAVCESAIRQAGAIIAGSFGEFERLVELATCLHGKSCRGHRVGVISNAGYETVGMADAVSGEGRSLQVPPLPDDLRETLGRLLRERSLDALVNLRNPLDLTPMADDAAYESAARAMLSGDAYDAVVVGVVPMTPQLLSTSDEMENPNSIAHRLARLFAESPKPLVVVIDAAEPYEALVAFLRSRGTPVFRRADEAMSALQRYLGSVSTDRHD